MNTLTDVRLPSSHSLESARRTGSEPLSSTSSLAEWCVGALKGMGDVCVPTGEGGSVVSFLWDVPSNVSSEDMSGTTITTTSTTATITNSGESQGSSSFRCRMAGLNRMISPCPSRDVSPVAASTSEKPTRHGKVRFTAVGNCDGGDGGGDGGYFTEGKARIVMKEVNSVSRNAPQNTPVENFM